MACSSIRQPVVPWHGFLTWACVCLVAMQLHADTSAVQPLPENLVQQVLSGETRIALVGDQSIFSGDILPTIDQRLSEAEQQIPESVRDQQRAMYVRRLLPGKIEVKLVLLDFVRTIPEDKRKEVLANIDKQVDQQFYDEQAPVLMKQLKVDSLTELEAKLYSFGTSINRQKAEFRDQLIAQTMIRQSIDKSPEITHEELLKEYYANISEYQFKPKVRWEKMTVLFKNFPDKAAADRAIVDMGNQVLRGASFAMVARQHSQDAFAKQGGLHGWTTEGALASDVLNKAIFSLPANRLSRILTDEDGFHIVRVLERKEAYQVPFVEAQDEIREKLQNEKRQQQIADYLEELRDKTYVETIFDDLSN